MPTVLIIDDVETDRQLMGQVVESTGCTAAFACDGEDGFEKARMIRPSLILLDVVMPRQDGFATCRQLKHDGETSGIPVVMVTCKAKPSDRFWGERQGADEFVNKPFTPNQLSEVIRRHIPWRHEE